jgi:hypothetical protein
MSLTQSFSPELCFNQWQSALSKEASLNKNHAERIACLKKRIQAVDRKKDVARAAISASIVIVLLIRVLYMLIIGVTTVFGIFLLDFIIELLATWLIVALPLLLVGFLVNSYFDRQLKPLEKEFAAIAKPENG